MWAAPAYAAPAPFPGGPLPMPAGFPGYPQAQAVSPNWFQAQAQPQLFPHGGLLAGGSLRMPAQGCYPGTVGQMLVPPTLAAPPAQPQAAVMAMARPGQSFTQVVQHPSGVAVPTARFVTPLPSACGTPVLAPTVAVQPASVVLPARAAVAAGETATAPVAQEKAAPSREPAASAGQEQAGGAVGEEDDPQALLLQSGLREVPVREGMVALQAASCDGCLTLQQFLACYEEILQSRNLQVPTEAVRAAVFGLLDRDGNGVVDMLELVCGVSLLCGGSDDDKIAAVFAAFDSNGDGYISLDEMFKFLTSVFKVGLTPQALSVMNSMGVTVKSAEELASETAIECFRSADLSKDGRLSMGEFKDWFYGSGHDPAFLFSPMTWRHLDFH